MWNIALNTFREYTRNYFWTLLVFCSGVFPIVLVFLWEISLKEFSFVIPTLGLSFLEIILCIFLIFIGGRLLVREREEKTLYLLLTRPIAHKDIILGKFLGFSWVLWIFFLVLSSVLFILMLGFGVDFSAMIFVALIGFFVKILSLLVILLLFSVVFSGGILPFLLIAIYIIGHSGYFLLQYALLRSDQFYALVAKWILCIFPNFAALNFHEDIYVNAIDWLHVGQVFLFAGAYMSIILFLTCWLFSKKSWDAF